MFYLWIFNYDGGRIRTFAWEPCGGRPVFRPLVGTKSTNPVDLHVSGIFLSLCNLDAAGSCQVYSDGLDHEGTQLVAVGTACLPDQDSDPDISGSFMDPGAVRSPQVGDLSHDK